MFDQQHPVILFVVDHKHRDLPSLSLIAYHLKINGARPYFASLPAANQLARLIQPDTIVVPKPWNYHDYLDKLVTSKSTIIVVQSEGNPQTTLEETFTVFDPIDAYFFWNQTEMDKAKFDPGLSNAELRILGNPRLDFLHKKNRRFVKNINKKRLNIDSSKKSLTIATRLVYANARPDALRGMRRADVISTDSFDAMVDQDLQQKKLIVDGLEAIWSIDPQVNVLLKPHPNENMSFWRGLQAKYRELIVITGHTIDTVLSISDFNVSNVSCTTTGEARIAGVRSAEVSTKMDSFVRTDEKRLPDYLVESGSDFLQIIDFLRSNDETSLAELRNPDVIPLPEYLEKYYFAFDGVRCEAYANAILSFVKSQPKTTPSRFKTSALRHLISNYSKARSILPTFHVQKRFWKGITDSRGRYDNRVSIGDEHAWYKRFRKHS